MTTTFESPKDIDKEIQRLQKLREDLIKKEKRPEIRRIVKTMNDFSITLEEIEKEYSRQSRLPSALNVRGIDKPKTQPKFRDPDSGAEWSGRGIAPRWIRSAEEQGQSRDDFLIEKQEALVEEKKENASQASEGEASSTQPSVDDSNLQQDNKQHAPKSYNIS